MKTQPTLTPVSGPHAHTGGGIPSIMVEVILALLPAALFGVWLFGWPALNLLLVTIAATLASEALALRVAGKRLLPNLLDGTALLSAVLLVMTLPPWAPWWIGVVGGALAMFIGKHVFGGTGNNLFNPAMVARVALLISFPVQMTTWITPTPFGSAAAPDFLTGLQITFLGYPAPFDAVTTASILGHIKSEQGLGNSVEQALQSGLFGHWDAGLGLMSGSMGETSALLVLLGGIYLMARRIISWHIPLSMLGTIALLATTMHLIDPQRYPDALFHLLSGAVMLGAFFIATDLVTSPGTRTGQLIFGAGCGLLVYLIRSWGGYPEGVAFAVLLMNGVTPLIDHYVRPRIYGRNRKGLAIEPTGGQS
jgi:electron transport complex protein RnfD